MAPTSSKATRRTKAKALADFCLYFKDFETTKKYATICRNEALRQLSQDRLPLHKTSKKKLKKLFPLPEEIKDQKTIKDFFCDMLGALLHKRLQPNFAKYGKVLHAGQCPFYIFDWYFGTHHTSVKRSERNFKDTVDGLPVNRKVIYYRWKNQVPDLGLGYDWFKRDHGDFGGMSPFDIHSEYVSITLSIDVATGRVNYRQQTVVTATGMIIA